MVTMPPTTSIPRTGVTRIGNQVSNIPDTFGSGFSTSVLNHIINSGLVHLFQRKPRLRRASPPSPSALERRVNGGDERLAARVKQDSTAHPVHRVTKADFRVGVGESE